MKKRCIPELILFSVGFFCRLVPTRFRGRFDRLYFKAIPIFLFYSTLSLYPFCAVISWLRIIVKKVLFIKPSIIWGPTPILNISDSSKLLNRIGYKSKTLVYTVYHITSDFDYVLAPYLKNQHTAVVMPHLVFLWSLLRFDIYHYFYDTGFWHGMKIVPHAKWLELPLLRLAGKRIIASAYGADVRMKHLNERWTDYNLCNDCPEIGKGCICTYDGIINTKYYREWCNEILAMGDMHEFVFGSKMDFSHWPIDVAKVKYVGVEQHSGPLRIVHSPNHRHFKGTKYIEAAISNLKNKGYDIDFIIVENMPNHEAKAVYASADIIVAQCILGWPGYTEIEGMAAGKPVITYIRDPQYFAHTNGCPLISAHPGILEAEIENLINNPLRRIEIGENGRQYIEKYWSYEALAPHYENLHIKVWRKNGLIAVIRNKISDFLNGDTGYRAGKTIIGRKNGEWPVFSNPFLNLSRIKDGAYGIPPFDQSGIPRCFYNGEYVTHPGVISLYTMNCFHALLKYPDNKEYQDGFSRGAKWLKDNLTIDEKGIGRWYYHFKCVGRECTVPWTSSFILGIALPMILRAEEIFPGQGYIESAKNAAALYNVCTSEGGVLYEEDGITFLEEYPEIPPSHVFNGWITGLFGLYEYFSVTQEPWAKELFNRSLHSLKKMIPAYETKEGLRYCLKHPTVVNTDYYYYQIQQMMALYNMTKDKVFYKKACSWKMKMYWSRLRDFVIMRNPL